MFNWRHAKLFLSMVVVCVTYAQIARAEDGPPITLRNDLSDPIDLYIASEKSQSDSPWHHFRLEGGQSHKVNVIAPDRYFVVLQIGNERSRSKPLELKKFATAHPDYVMLVSEIRDMSLGAPMGGGSEPAKPVKIGATISPDRNGPTPSDYASLPLEFEHYDANDQSIWSLSNDSVVLKLHNDLNDPVNVYIASKKSQNPNPWTQLQIEPDGDSSIILKSPDPFMIRVDVGNESARSKPIELKAFLANHRDYVLNVGKGYQQMMAGGPMNGGGGGEDEKSPRPSLSVKPDPNRQNANPGGDQLNIDWEN